MAQDDRTKLIDDMRNVDKLVLHKFRKLDVADRTTAAIEEIGAGFLHKGELPD